MPFSRRCRKRESPRASPSCPRNRRLCLPSLGVGAVGAETRSSRIGIVGVFGSRECRLCRVCRFGAVYVAVLWSADASLRWPWLGKYWGGE